LTTQNNEFQYRILEANQEATVWRLLSDVSLQVESGNLDFKIQEVEAAFKRRAENCSKRATASTNRKSPCQRQSGFVTSSFNMLVAQPGKLSGISSGSRACGTATPPFWMPTKRHQPSPAM
jgi:hypothetical protein